jgi:hypothetical protein
MPAGGIESPGVPEDSQQKIPDPAGSSARRRSPVTRKRPGPPIPHPLTWTDHRNRSHEVTRRGFGGARSGTDLRAGRLSVPEPINGSGARSSGGPKQDFRSRYGHVSSGIPGYGTFRLLGAGGFPALVFRRSGPPGHSTGSGSASRNRASHRVGRGRETSGTPEDSGRFGTGRLGITSGRY